MNILQRFANALAAPKKTTNGVPDPNSFLRFGNRRMMPSTWTTPEITDQDFYTGIGFAVINKRANRSVVLGKKFLYTDAKEEIIASANEKGARVTHPYLPLIRNSIDFSERDFWYDISTYLDLEGVYYLMAVRAVAPNRVGNIQSFTLLNPYWVRPVINSDGKLGGYVEHNPYLGDREIPKEMIIVINNLNPFDERRNWSLADAARDSQFTLKQANDFAREAIDGNLNAPGILSSAIELPDDQFDNFVDRVKNHGRGEPLFGNGAGTVHWENMQTDLDKAALDKINSINRDVLISISGLSTSGMGLEQPGTGREVSRTQKDDFTENAIMPQIENIIDALNLDYRRFYPTSYASNGYTIALDNPLETNRDAEQADVDIRDSQFTLMESLVAKGYDRDLAAKYAKGLIDITDLGEPTNPVEPVNPTNPDDGTPSGDGTDPNQPATPQTPPAKPKSSVFNIYEGYPIPVTQYLEDSVNQVIPISEKGSFINSTETDLKTVRINHIADVNNTIVAVVDENTSITLGQFTQNADKVSILAKLNKRYKNQPVAIKKRLDHECKHDVYEAIKNAVFDHQTQIETNTANLLSSTASAEERLFRWYETEIANGNLNPSVTLDQFINSLALPFATYFTIMFPIYASQRVKQTAEDMGIQDEVPLVAMTDEIKSRIKDFADKEATSHMNTIKSDIENELAKIRAKTSDPQEIQQLLEIAFNDIQKRRAMTIANTAAARIYNMSQYEADAQFLTRVGKTKQAYKQLFSLTGDPCSVCAYLIQAPMTPFNEPFVQLNATIETDDKKQTFGYEQVVAGNVHPNCHCSYRLIVKDDVA